MAESGSLELAPLRAKVILDLSELNEGIDKVNDLIGDLGKNFGKNIVEGSREATKTVEKLDEVLSEFEERAENPINLNVDNALSEEIELQRATEQAQDLGTAFNDVDSNIQQSITYVDTMQEAIEDLNNIMADDKGHDFIINFNGQQYSAMADDIKSLTNATDIYQEALERLTSEQGDFDEELNLDYYTIEEFQEEIKLSTQVLKDMIAQSQGLNIDLNDATEALESNIPLWNELTEEQQEQFKIVGELEYNLQALQARYLDVSNAIGNLGDSIENAKIKQESFNNSVQRGQSDVSEYNDEAMAFIASYGLIGENADLASQTIEENTEEVEKNRHSLNINKESVTNWARNWSSSAFMALMSIQMVTSTMGELLNTGSEVELSGVGLSQAFGVQGAQAIENFTKNANDANLTLQEVLPTAETLGLALHQYGGTKTEIAGVTTQIMNMANQLDLATGGAISFSDGADAIRQELAGQSYALKSLGINITTTMLNQTALNSKWHEAYSKMSSYQQAVIKVDALQGQLNKTFGKTSKYLDTQAGQYQKNIATFKNDMAKLGEALLPLANAILPEILNWVNKIVEVVNKIKDNKWLMNKIEFWGKIAVKIGAVVLVLAGVAKMVETVIRIFSMFKTVITIIGLVLDALDPVTLVITGIIVAVTLLYETWHHNWFNIRGITIESVKGIISTCEGFWHDMVDIWKDLCSSVSEIWTDYFVNIGADTVNFVSKIEDNFRGLWGDVTSIFTDLGSSVVNLWDYYIGGLPQRAEDICSDIINAFSSLVSDVEGIFSRIGSSVSSAFSDASSTVSELTGGVFMAMPSGLGSVPTVNHVSNTNIITNNHSLGAQPTPTSELALQTTPTIGELHIHSPQALDPLETYNQMQNWSINMANGIY